jgi:hypothetical protein
MGSEVGCIWVKSTHACTGVVWGLAGRVVGCVVVVVVGMYGGTVGGWLVVVVVVVGGVGRWVVLLALLWCSGASEYGQAESNDASCQKWQFLFSLITPVI